MPAATDNSAANLFTPLAPDFLADPYPYYHRMRELEPVFFWPLGTYVATRHADIAWILKDRRFGKLFEERMDKRHGSDVWRASSSYRSLGKMMLVQDPPDHTRLRGLVAKAFTARRMEDMRGQIQAIVDKLIDRVEGDGSMEIMSQFAHPLPVEVICDMLGIPESDRQPFYESSTVSGRLIDPTPMTPEETAHADESNENLAAYFADLFERRRKDPADDLISLLVQVEEAGEKLTEEELFANVILLFGAGHETTVNLIGNGLLALHRNPEQIDRLKADPSLMPNAIEELLRYDSSVQMTGRVCLEDIEVGGVAMKRGDNIINLLGAANRDPEVFENPDQLDVGRKGARAMSSFGGGIHHCLGAQLARIEGEVAIATLLRRLPDLKLDNAETPEWRPTFTLRGVKTLPASW
ncbi:MAG: cytochrome P450 [Alphaproteobacteria bacterium]